MSKRNNRIKKKAVDFTLFLTVILLVFMGIIMVFSSSWPEAMLRMDIYKSANYFLKKQIVSASLGFIVMLAVMNVDYKRYKNWAPLIYLLAIILGALLLSPLGQERKGATRWLNLGIISFMPSDVIKIASVIFFAAFLTNKRRRIKSLLHGTLPGFFYIGLSAIFIIKNDLGTAVVLLTTMAVMFFVGGFNLWHILPLPFVGYKLFNYFVYDESNAHRMRRMVAFTDPFKYKMNEGWQVVQSLYALGSGGLFGIGLGKSRQKFFYISESYNDFVFSIIAEELGLLGATFVIFLFLIVIWRGILIALRSEDLFASYLAVGITSLIAIQAMVHIAVVTSSLPTTGITLPFISYGGTSLIIYMAAVGILLNISRSVDLERS